MAAVFERSASKGTARLVLLALADEASKTGHVTAYKRSRAHIAAKCNCSVPAVRRAIADLVELGELEILKMGTGHTETDYRVVVESLVGGTTSDTPDRDAPATPGVSPAIPLHGGKRDPGGAAGDSPHIPVDPVVPVLPGMAAPSPRRQDEADHVIATAVFERSSPKPATPFVAVRKIAQRFLEAGHEPAAIEAAMLSVRTISIGWVESELNKNRPRGAVIARPPSTTRTASSGQVDDYESAEVSG